MAALTTLAFSAVPAAAADTWYASPGGSGSACTSGSPCSIRTALDDLGAKAGTGDTVVLLPGGAGEFYTVNAGAPVRIMRDVHVMGDAAAPRPLVKVGSSFSVTTPTFTFEADAAGSTLNHVAFETNGCSPVVAYGRVDVSDISAKARGGCLELRGPNSSLADATFDAVVPESSFVTCLTVFADGIQVRNVDLTSTKEAADAPPVPAASLYGAGVRVDGFRIRSQTRAVAASGSATNPLVIRRADLRGAQLGISLDAGVVLTDSLVTAAADSAVAISAFAGVLRNVTALATGTNSRGLSIPASGPDGITTDARNSIFRGDGKDISMEPDYPGEGYPGCEVILPSCIYIPPRPAGTLVIGNSNYRTTDIGTGATLTDAGGNSSADALFVNAGAADFHLSPGSPAIDAGGDFAQNGSTDLDGNPRRIGAAPDMGAYEYVPPPPPQDTAAPVVTGFDLTNEVFAVGRAATPVAARRARKGTTFVFRSSEAGTAKLAFSRARPGRRHGKRCVKPTRKHRRARRCTRYVAVRPALTRNVAAGSTAVPFSGRIGTRALRPGRNRAKLVVTDAAGNRSKARTVSFRIVRR